MALGLHNIHYPAQNCLAECEVWWIGVENGEGHDDTPSASDPHRFLLIVDIPATGYTTVLTFATRFDRALQMLVLSAQPVVLCPRDYE